MIAVMARCGTKQPTSLLDEGCHPERKRCRRRETRRQNVKTLVQRAYTMALLVFGAPTVIELIYTP